MKYIFIFIISTFLFGCSSLKKKDCSNLDWNRQGQIDGEDGKRSSYFVQHSLACKTRPDKSEYLKGRQVGLVKFCTFKGGFTDALKGQIYLGQCRNSPNLKVFKKGRSKGSDIYAQKEKVSSLKTKLIENERDFKHQFSDSSEMSEYNNDIQILKREIKLEEVYLNKLLRNAAIKGFLK